MAKKQTVCTKQPSQQWVKDLKKSPVFNMSLSGKELFHSNFLAWAIEQYPKQAKEFFCKVIELEGDTCKCECDDNSIQCVDREVKKQIKVDGKKVNTSIDLKFKVCDYTIFLENKFKSIAYEEQLDNYLTAYDEGNCNKFILLSLKTPNFFNGSTTYNNWTLVTYDKLLDGFCCKIVKQETDCYKKGLIQDYINFVQKLIDEILPIFTNFQNDQLSISNLHINKPQTDENKILEQFKEIRLQDLLQKGIYEDFANKLATNANLPKPIVYGQDVQKPNHISIHFDYSNDQGLVDIRYTTQDKCSLGVQIQGKDYRQYVLATNKNKEAEKFAECLFCNSTQRQWFTHSNLKGSGRKDALKLCNQSESFKKFTIKDGRLFIYRSMELNSMQPQPISNSDLIAQIIEDMQKAIKIQNCDCQGNS